MAGERVTTTETLPPTELGEKAFSAMEDVVFKLLHNQDFANATARRFFSPYDSELTPLPKIDRTVSIDVYGGHSWKVNYKRRKSFVDLGLKSLVHGQVSPLLEEYTKVEIEIERFSHQLVSEGKMILGSDFQITQTQDVGDDEPVVAEKTYIGGKINVPGAEPDTKEALAAIPSFLEDFYPKLHL